MYVEVRTLIRPTQPASSTVTYYHDMRNYLISLSLSLFFYQKNFFLCILILCFFSYINRICKFRLKSLHILKHYDTHFTIFSKIDSICLFKFYKRILTFSHFFTSDYYCFSLNKYFKLKNTISGINIYILLYAK